MTDKEIEKVLAKYNQKENHVSEPIDFEKELYKAFGQVKDFTLGMRIAKWFYDMGKNSQEPVSGDFETALEKKVREAQDWTYIEEEGGECPLNEEFGAYDLEEFARWGAEWVMKNEKEPTSENLEKAASVYMEKEMEKGAWYIDEITDDFYYRAVDLCSAFKAGANWQKEQFEKNRLKRCNSITNEQAELEQGFIDQHLDKYNCMPSYLDAIEYGMKLQIHSAKVIRNL